MEKILKMLEFFVWAMKFQWTSVTEICNSFQIIRNMQTKEKQWIWYIEFHWINSIIFEAINYVSIIKIKGVAWNYVRTNDTEKLLPS